MWIYTYAIIDADSGETKNIQVRDKEGRDWVASRKTHMLIDLAYDGLATAVMIKKERKEKK